MSSSLACTPAVLTLLLLLKLSSHTPIPRPVPWACAHCPGKSARAAPPPAQDSANMSPSPAAFMGHPCKTNPSHPSLQSAFPAYSSLEYLTLHRKLYSYFVYCRSSFLECKHLGAETFYPRLCFPIFTVSKATGTVDGMEHVLSKCRINEWTWNASSMTCQISINAWVFAQNRAAAHFYATGLSHSFLVFYSF